MKRRNFLIGAAAVTAGAGGFGVFRTHRALADYQAYTARLHRPLDPSGGVGELVRMATLAPNGHNTQAWTFRTHGTTLELFPDFSRRTPVVDPDDHHIFVSLGAAAENLVLAGAALGMPGELEARDDGAIRFAWQNGPAKADPLAATIVRRQSTRSLYDGRAVDAVTLKALTAAGRADGVRLVLITERKQINAVRDLVVAGNDVQMSNPAFITELKQWLRFSPANAMARGDGLYSAASGSPALPDFLGRPAFDLVFKKKSEAEKYAAQIDSSAGVAVFFAEHAGKHGWVQVGCAAERFLLEATRQGVACAFINQPVEVAGLRPVLAMLAREKDLRPDLVIRFGHATPLPFSPRRRVQDILATS
jgi:nitroreductase